MEAKKKKEEEDDSSASSDDYSDDEQEGEADYRVGGYHRVQVSVCPRAGACSTSPPPPQRRAARGLRTPSGRRGVQ